MEKWQELDSRLVAVAKKIKVLTVLAWPDGLYEGFLGHFHSGNPKNPELPHSPRNFTKQIAELKSIMDCCDPQDPLQKFLFNSAESYWLAAQMLEAVGTPAFTELSIRLYGKPTDHIGSAASLTHLQAADHFVETTRDFISAFTVTEGEYCITAEEVARQLETELVPFFQGEKVDIVIEPSLNAKAVAGSSRIRIRANTCFSPLDIEQLMQHEGYVHLLSAINGRKQKNLKSLALGSPRTTRTQEGLATFAELITSSMDLCRLQRIALRIHAVQMGTEGASFIDIFRFFLNAGQDEKESFQSTARIFRGGNPAGKVVLTKDVVYLQGLIFTHTFLRKTVQGNKFKFAEYLFSGRLTLGDVVALEPYFESGFISPPVYVPPWLLNRTSLAAYLCYAVFANRIALGDFSLKDFA